MSRRFPANRDRRDSLPWLLSVAVPLVFFTIGGAIAVAVVIEQSIAPDAWSLGETAALFVAAALLELFWLRVVTEERDLLLELGEGLMEGWRPRGGAMFLPSHGHAWRLVLLSGAAFLLLMILAIWPAAFGAMLLVIRLLETWNASLSKRHVNECLQLVWGATELPPPQQERGIDLKEWKRQACVIDDYYFRRPWYEVAVTGVVVLAFATVVAVYGARDTDVAVRHFLGVVATVLMLTVLAANELVAWTWRAWRDKELGHEPEAYGKEPRKASRRDYEVELARKQQLSGPRPTSGGGRRKPLTTAGPRGADWTALPSQRTKKRRHWGPAAAADRATKRSSRRASGSRRG
jgi:hypothetical protein